MSRATARAWVAYNLLNVPDEPSLFEVKVKKLGLQDSPEKWASSPALQKFVRANRKRHYIPEWLIRDCGLSGYDEGE